MKKSILRTMSIQEAKQITGGLSNPSKMPSKSYGLPAQDCKTGSKLVHIKGSVCHGCYALRGMYRFGNVQKAQRRRLDSLGHSQWVEAMVVLVKRYSPDVFRWHDSGDLQGLQHLKKIFEVCELTPNTKHWIPTREAGILKEYKGTVPKNLAIRLSSTMIGDKPMSSWPLTSTVHKKDQKFFGRECPAPTTNNECGTCRACWDQSIPNISYNYH
jgi:hypothetical protein